MTNGDGWGNSVTLNLAGGTLTNSAKKGAIEAEVAHGGNRTIEGNLVNEGTVATSATLKVTGSFTEQGKKPVFKTSVSSTGTFGELVSGGPATILGELSITQPKKPQPPFVPTVGEKFPIVSSSAADRHLHEDQGQQDQKGRSETVRADLLGYGGDARSAGVTPAPAGPRGSTGGRVRGCA